MDKWLNDVLIDKRLVLHQFFDKDFQHGVPFKSLFRIPHYSQKIFYLIQMNFCGRMLPGYKTENVNSPQKSIYHIF